MDIKRELLELHSLAGETTLLNFRALMQERIRNLLERIENEPLEISRDSRYICTCGHLWLSHVEDGCQWWNCGCKIQRELQG